MSYKIADYVASELRIAAYHDVAYSDDHLDELILGAVRRLAEVDAEERVAVLGYEQDEVLETGRQVYRNVQSDQEDAGSGFLGFVSVGPVEAVLNYGKSIVRQVTALETYARTFGEEG